MTEKAEWEVVDEPRRKSRPQLQELLKNLLGPWWRWKIAGAVTALGVALLFLFTFAAVFVVGLMVTVVLSIAVGKIRLWLRGHRQTALRKRE